MKETKKLNDCCEEWVNSIKTIIVTKKTKLWNDTKGNRKKREKKRKKNEKKKPPEENDTKLKNIRKKRD